MNLPSYPLVTVDPFFSIWSPSENLYDSDTIMWYGKEKRLSGTIEIDGCTLRFMGKGINRPIAQKERRVTPYITYYIFENNEVRLEARFYTPSIIDEIRHLGSPVSYIEYKISILDGKKHSINIKTSLASELCYNKGRKAVIAETIKSGSVSMAKMGLVKQEPLSQWGDGCSSEWGYYYIAGGKSGTGKGRNCIYTVNSCSTKTEAEFCNVAAYDDIYSVEYMGQKLKGLWHENHRTIEDCIKYYLKNRDEIYAKLLAQNEKILADARLISDDYAGITAAASRQILAGHKLVRNCEGELLYLSKECHSNGSINTVDVSYPAQPFFLIYNPELVKAMMTGIFFYATSKAWSNDFAPHDIGTYPIADGQTYALTREMEKYRRVIYKEPGEYHNPRYQMPVEECGNMLVMSYSYIRMSGDTSQAEKYYDTLKLWCDFLIKKGVVLDTQLCTDDFAGHSEKNVNLAIKSIMGIACFGRICEALGKPDEYTGTAKKFAKELVSLTDKNVYLSFAIGQDDTWSLKYNMVWDELFGFNFFSKKIKRAECKKYNEEMNIYGVPLDFRKDFTKSDWEMWAACLDETDGLADKLANAMLAYLNDTKEIYPFSDWTETLIAERRGFAHRTVQGGLWMPVLKKKLLK